MGKAREALKRFMERWNYHANHTPDNVLVPKDIFDEIASTCPFLNEDGTPKIDAIKHQKDKDFYNKNIRRKR